MAGIGTHWKRGDAALIAGLASGLSVKAAAKKAKVSTRTAFRRLADPAFLRQVDKAKEEAIRQASSRLAATSVKAAGKLRALLGSKDERVSLQAAWRILKLAMPWQEFADMERRLAALEKPKREDGKHEPEDDGKENRQVRAGGAIIVGPPEG
jgi:hypothetical protein